MSTQVFYQTLGFLRSRRIRRILRLSGQVPRAGVPPKGGQVLVWGRTGYARRGHWIAARRGAKVLTVEDAFLHSVKTGRSGAEPLGLVLDRKGVHFDASAPNDLEDLLNNADLDRPDLQARARAGIAFLARHHLSKYNATDPDIPSPGKGYVLVVDQTKGDASVRLGGADQTTFRDMLAAARAENPGRKIVIKTHPETYSGNRSGYYSRADQDERTEVFSAPATPQTLLEAAHKVYVVSSQMGFEAICAGQKPVVFGKPFYAGWGLSDDRQSLARRHRRLSREGLFAGVMLLYPTWYDPYRDALCDFEDVARILAAQARAWREDCHGYLAIGIRRWKRTHFRRFFRGAGLRLSFAEDKLALGEGAKPGLVWAGKETREVRRGFEGAKLRLSRVEDGFLRSNGLGADLVPPLSMVVDDLGIYYDPECESRLERILNGQDLSEAEAQRALDLRDRLIAARLSKYNLEGKALSGDLPRNRKIILVPGQVEDDQSILKATSEVRTNQALLAATRARNPDAFLIYKPHPDVEAGLRKGALETPREADLILSEGDPIAAIEAVDEVWTMTSLLGFEALLRGRSVTCLGTPFYAGWGLTSDLGPVVERRRARPTLAGLIHACLIEYPRYFDPVTCEACPVETAVERLEAGVARGGPRWLAKLQGWFSPLAFLWR